MQLRIGIHLGDVIIEGDDIHGDGVNIAARLEGLAQPGGICVSDMVHAGVRNKLALSFDDLGEQSLKNIADPLQVFSIELGKATAADSVTTATRSISRPAVAVLPFENMSGESDQDYFADGLTEDIITALSMFRSIPVIARNSTFGYKGQSPDIRNVGKELGARYVVEGSVRKAGSRVRVTCQLINAETGHHVWAERYDRELEDIFALQDEISQRIAAIIEPTLERAEEQRTVTKPPSSLAAWDYYARGNAHIWEWTKVANDLARDMFKQAIQLDPQFARAHIGLAFTYARETRFFAPPDREECQRLLFESARRAVTLDEMDAQARVVLALAYAMTQQPDAAVAEAKRAVELNPYDAAVNNCRGLTLSLSAARFEEGIAYTERALQQNPLDPNNQLYMTQLALAQLCAERYDKAVEHAQEAIRRRHDFLEAHLVLASAFGYLGRQEEARSAIEGYADIAESYIEQHVVFAPQVKAILLDGLRQANLLE
jgi:adenylate cyclase